ncbi:MAG: anti-sigma factor [Pseudomonadales bacterium]
MTSEQGQANPITGHVADVESLLPWYINGSLDTAQSRDVEQWLLQCDQARARLQAWQCIAQNTSNLTREYASHSADERGAWSSIETALSTNTRAPREKAPLANRRISGQLPKSPKALLFIRLGVASFVMTLLIAFLLGAIQ